MLLDFETWRVFRRLMRLARRLRSPRHIAAVKRWAIRKQRTEEGG